MWHRTGNSVGIFNDWIVGISDSMSQIMKKHSSGNQTATPTGQPKQKELAADQPKTLQ
jgi:hypothetical protein